MKRDFYLLTIVALSAIVLLTLSAGMAAPPRAPDVVFYEVSDLGFEGIPLAINNNGVVTGQYDNADDDPRAFRWQDGTLTDLGSLGGDSYGHGLNDDDQVVGCSDDEGYHRLLPVRWDGSEAVELPGEGCGHDINDDEKTAGWLWTGNEHGAGPNPALWDGTEAKRLGLLPGDDIGQAHAINDAGQIVGYTRAWNCPCDHHAFLWSDEEMSALPTLGGAGSEAFDINDAGKAVGRAYTADGAYHPVLWDGDAVTDLAFAEGYNGTAVAINNQDQVLLRGGGPGGYYLWDSGVWIDLSEAIDPASGWELYDVVDINDEGWILGQGALNGDDRVIILKPCLSCIPTPTPSPAPTATPELVDIEITGMEISQGIQNLDNEMPLVEDRTTWIRGYLKASTSLGVSGKLYAFRNGSELADSPIEPVHNFAAAVEEGSNRLNTVESLNFKIPPEWRSGTVTFRVVVNEDDEPPETDTGNNVMEETVTFQPGQTLNVTFVPLHLHEGGNGDNPAQVYTFNNHPQESGIIVSNLGRYHPVPNVRRWQAPVLHPPGHDAGGDEWNISTDEGASKVLNAIRIYNLFTVDAAGQMYYAGMVHPSLTAAHGGLGGRPGRESWTEMRADNGGYDFWNIVGGGTLAHELGHNKGLQHVNCANSEGTPDPDYPWPYPNCRLATVDEAGYFGLDVEFEWYLYSVNSADPAVISNDPQAALGRAFPLMGYQWPRWISPYEYCKLLPTYGIPCNLAWPAPSVIVGQRPALSEVAANPLAYADPQAVQALEEAPAHIVATGLINTGDGTVDLDSVYGLEEISPDALQQAGEELGYKAALAQGDPYRLLQLDAAGTVLHYQEILLNVSDGAWEPFLEVAPLLTDTVKIEVQQSGNVLAQREASANRPTVTLLAPNGGETLQAGDVISWSAADANGDDLSFNLLYSADDGATWRAMALGVRGDSYELPSLAGIAGSEQARLRVMANDGWHTVEDESDGVFTIPGSDPLATLLAPLDGATLAPGRPHVLHGLATDDEDGPLSGDSLSWFSDVDGDLGSGQEVWVAELSWGWHTLTLTATDSEGQTSSSSVRVSVGYRAHLPAVLQP